MAPKPSNNEDEDMLLRLLFVGARGEEKTELEEYVEDDDIDEEESAIDKLGTETLFGLEDIAEEDVPEEEVLLAPETSLPEGATWFSDPRPNTTLLLVPSHAVHIIIYKNFVNQEFPFLNNVLFLYFYAICVLQLEQNFEIMKIDCWTHKSH